LTAAESKAIARRFFEEQDRLRGGPADEVCAPGYTAHLGSFPAMDLDGHKQFAAAFYAAFPDLYHEIQDVIGEEDQAVVRFTLHGTHRGPFMGVEPTGRQATITAMAVMRLREGRVGELYGQFDALGMLQQLGAIPAPGE
jgi:predicted ester cyclase